MSEPVPITPSASDPFEIPGRYIPAKSAEVLDLDMEDGLVLFNRGSSLVHHLNPSAALVWQLFDGEGSVEQISVDIAEEYHLDTGVVQEQVGRLVGEFEALGLITNANGEAH